MTDAPKDETVDAVAAQRIEIVGDPTPEEVAALVAVLSAASGAAVSAVAVGSTRHTSQWSAPGRAMRRPLAPGSTPWHHPLHP